MGVEYWLHGSFYLDDIPESFVSDTVTAFQQNGFTTATDTSERIQRYRYRTKPKGADDRDTQTFKDADHSLATVADRIHGRTTSGWARGKIELWHEDDNAEINGRWHPHPDHTFSATFNVGNNEKVPLQIRGPDEWYFDVEQEYDTDTRVASTVASFETLAERVDPWVAMFRMHCDHGRGKTIPKGRPPDHGLDALPWLIVFGEEWFEFLGGRTRILDAPAYETRRLETGSVLVRQRKRPTLTHDDINTGPPESAFEYLFER